MLFDKRKEKKSKARRKKRSSSLGEKIHKFIFFAGLIIALKGLKGWVRCKKRKMAW